MKLNFVFALAAGALAIGLLSGGVAAAQPSQKDITAMQGVWTVESLTLEGHTVSSEQLKNWRRIVEPNNHVTWKNGTETIMELDIKFDPSQKPMTLDSTIATRDGKEQTLLAIYELNDDELRVCFASLGKPRPTEFSSALGSGQSLYGQAREAVTDAHPYGDC
jgi:uncharacterized protein (TIGR03067 family)